MFRGLSYLLLSAMILVTSCGGGGGSGQSGDPALTVFPADGMFLKRSELLTITLSNNRSDGSIGTFVFILAKDPGMVEVMDTSDMLTEDGNGNVSWTPNATYNDNRPYYWTWSATFGTARTEPFASPVHTIYVLKDNEMNAAGPADSKDLDQNLSLNPALSVTNVYTHGEVGVSYDFELFSGSDTNAVIASAYGVPQANNEESTHGTMPIGPLDPNVKYYWRARPTVNGAEWNWTQLYSFTIKNMCEIGGSGYAERIVSWTRVRDCDEKEFNDPEEALGPMDAETDSEQGFLSLDVGGSLVVEMGATVANGDGPDIRIWEYVSIEPIEVLASYSEAGPWNSLSSQWCGEFCDFDLAAAGMPYARFFKIVDLWPQSERCHRTSGADIDSVEALNTVDDPNQCTL